VASVEDLQVISAAAAAVLEFTQGAGDNRVIEATEIVKGQCCQVDQAGTMVRVW
jgi:hypothetical protein